AGNARGKSSARTRQHRQSREERVTCCRVRVVRQSVEKEIGRAMLRLVSGHGRSLREHKPVRLDAPFFRFEPKIAVGGSTAVQEPKNAPVDAPQQAHPDVEYVRCDLETIVEAAEYKAVL